jgi:hypothetical protein
VLIHIHDLTLFNSHTGDTSNPHQTSFSSLTSTAHTHTISEVVNLQTELDGKTDNTDFTSHTGDTTIHYTKGSINLSDLGSSAHTHTLSEITDFNTYSGNVQTQLDTKIQNGVNSGGANEVFTLELIYILEQLVVVVILQYLLLVISLK